MARPIEMYTNKVIKRGFDRRDSVYLNADNDYSPIVLEIEQIRERGIWANDPLITTNEPKDKELYMGLFEKIYGTGNKLLLNLRLFEKRLYRWGWVALLVRFYGNDKIKYSLEFESRKIEAVNRNIDTGVISRVDCCWYFETDGFSYKVLEQWDSEKCVRKLYQVNSNIEISLPNWNTQHQEQPINDWFHNYGVIPLVIVVNTLGENGEAKNGFYNAIKHIDKLDRLEEEINDEIIGSRSKMYYAKGAFTHLVNVNGDLVEQVMSEDDIVNSKILAIEHTNTTLTGGDNLNDTLKSNVPIIQTQFDRNGLSPLQIEKDKLITQIYTMLGFTNPNQTSVVPRTATEMEYYNENTASTLKNMALDRTTTLMDLIALMIEIGVSQSYSGFDSKMKVEALTIKVIPNIKTDEMAFLDLQLKKYQNNLLNFKELKEIVDNSDKDVVEQWVKDNLFSLLTETQVKIFNDLSGEIDKENRLRILFDNLIDDKTIKDILNKVEGERPTNPLLTMDGELSDDDNEAIGEDIPPIEEEIEQKK